MGVDSFFFLFGVYLLIIFLVVKYDEKSWEQVKNTLTHSHQNCFKAYDKPPHGH